MINVFIFLQILIEVMVGSSFIGDIVIDNVNVSFIECLGQS